MNNPTDEKREDVKKVKVTLKQPLTQNRTEHQVGEEIQVRPDQKERLAKQGII